MNLPDFLKAKPQNPGGPMPKGANTLPLYESQKDSELPLQNPAAPIGSQTTIPQKPLMTDPSFEVFQKGTRLLDVMAPQKVEVDFNHIKINNTYFRVLYISGYPRFVSPGWLEPIINFDGSLDISFYLYPVEGKTVLDDLRRKIAEMEAEISTDLERGKIADPATQAKLEDALSMQEQLVKGIERFFLFSFYITVPASSLEELNNITKQIKSTLGSLLIVARNATLDMANGFLSTIPLGMDKLSITQNMDSTSLATTFPLTSAELSSDKGVLYGINSQNESFIIFDRFSLENANMTIFATAGAGKSVDYDEPVLFQDATGGVKLEKVGRIVESLIKKNSTVQLEKDVEGVLNPNIKVFAFDKQLKTRWSSVSIAARKTSPNNLYKITTKSGRNVKITKDHCLITLKGGVLEALRGDKVMIGDHVPVPRSVAGKKALPKPLDIYGLLKGNKRIKHLKKIGGRVGNRLFSAKTSMPETLTPTPHFFEILGYFSSEGMVSPTKSLISSTSKSVLTSAKKYFESIGLAYSYVRKNGNVIGIYASAQVFNETLRAIGVSGKAGKKRVPPIIFSAPDNYIASYLRAYFEGDGGGDGHEISATTKSKSLASDLAHLLFRFGIIARISKSKKAASNTKNKTKRTYYRVRISGHDNIRKFIKQIGFVSRAKNEGVKKLLKKGNTNVDVVPELGPIFKEIYEALYSSTETPSPKKFSEIKLGIFKPSPVNLLGVVEEIEKRIEEMERLESDGLSTLQKLPTLEEIILKGKTKKNNTLLWKKLGASWSTMRSGVKPYLANTLSASLITHQQSCTQGEIAQALYKCFKTTGVSLRKFDKSLWESLVIGKKNPQYERVVKARNYITQEYSHKTNGLNRIKQKINWLKTLATANLFWDPVVKVEKIKSKHKYVYDLQVDNAVFLAGHGGMFVHNSYFVKLESLRSLMLGTEIVVIDPEAEYEALAHAVGGEFISFSFSSRSKINPFDLSQVYVEGENQLGLKILTLHSLFKVIMGQLTPIQEALLDRALVATYRGKGITQDPATQKREPPLMEDLYKILIGMETNDALDLAARIEKFVKGSFVGIFDQQTNININNPFTVFSVKDMQEALRPIAMFVILDFIWTRIQRDLKRRLLIVDEAWHMMRYPDSAQFLWSVAKRARKYYLGLTTITQDVEDFLAQDIGKAIVTNSALRLLLKQSPAAIDKIGQVFYLSQGEKQLLLAANIGEGIFFAGPHHAPIRVVASPEEHPLITTKPQERISQGRPTQFGTDQKPNIPVVKNPI